MCRREYLHYLRVREWQDVYSQLQQAARDLGIVGRPGSRAEAAHEPRRPERKQPTPGWQRAAEEEPAGTPATSPTGCTSRCWPGCSRTSACRTPSASRPIRAAGERRGAAAAGAGRSSSPAPAARGSRSSRTHRWRASRRPGSWQPSWSRRPGCGPGRSPGSSRSGPSRSAGDLVRRSYSEPRWDARRGAVMAAEKVTPVRPADRRRAPGELRPASTRPPPGSCSSSTPWSRATGRPTTGSSQHNQRAREEAEELEHKARRRGLVADDTAVFDFYDRPDPEDGHLGPALRLLVEEGPRRRSRPARPQPGRPGRAGRRRDPR